jgi:hypothetical protein
MPEEIRAVFSWSVAADNVKNPQDRERIQTGRMGSCAEVAIVRPVPGVPGAISVVA